MSRKHDVEDLVQIATDRAYDLIAALTPDEAMEFYEGLIKECESSIETIFTDNRVTA